MGLAHIAASETHFVVVASYVAVVVAVRVAACLQMYIVVDQQKEIRVFPVVDAALFGMWAFAVVAVGDVGAEAASIVEVWTSRALVVDSAMCDVNVGCFSSVGSVAVEAIVAAVGELAAATGSALRESTARASFALICGFRIH